MWDVLKMNKFAYLFFITVIVVFGLKLNQISKTSCLTKTETFETMTEGCKIYKVSNQCENATFTTVCSYLKISHSAKSGTNPNTDSSEVVANESIIEEDVD